MDNEELRNVQYTDTELVQIHLALVSRSAFVTQVWASSVDAKQQEALAKEIQFLNDLAQKVAKSIGKGSN